MKYNYIGPKVYVSPCQYVHLTKHVIKKQQDFLHMLEINLHLFKLQVKLRTI